MNDNELTEALRGLYASDEPSAPERVEDTADVEYEPKVCCESFNGMGEIRVTLDYKQMQLTVNRADAEVVMPFDEAKQLYRFLSWAIPNRLNKKDRKGGAE